MDVANVKKRRVENVVRLDPDDLISTKMIVDRLLEQKPSPIFYFEAHDGGIGFATPFMMEQFHLHASKGVYLVRLLSHFEYLSALCRTRHTESRRSTN